MMRKGALVGPAIVLAGWFILSISHAVKPIFLPSPQSVMAAAARLFATGAIFEDLGYTVMRWLVGLLIGISAGVPIGMIMGYSLRAYNMLEVVVDFFRSIPAMTLFPLFLVFFGLGDRAKIAVAAWTAFFYILINVIYGVRQSRETRLMLARLLRASKIQTFVKFILPDALPHIVGGIRVSISISLIVVVASEMIMGTRAGLGNRIFEAALVYEMPEMYATIMVTGLLGYFSNKVFAVIESRNIHWSGK